MNLDSIAVLCPTRGRPYLFKRMVTSAVETAHGSFHIYAYLDDDDLFIEAYEHHRAVDYIRGPSNGVGRAWNMLAEYCHEPLLMMANDDLVFHTQDWDLKIIEAAKRFSDGIFVAWVNDGNPAGDARCTFPIVSREWVRVLGQFAPTCFHFLWHDTWLHDIGMRLTSKLEAPRWLYLPDVLIEHKHFAFGKAPMDETYKRHRTQRDSARKRQEDRGMFTQTADKRDEAAKVLAAHVRTCHA